MYTLIYAMEKSQKLRWSMNFKISGLTPHFNQILGKKPLTQACYICKK